MEARRLAFACAVAALAVGGCASTKRQDENEPAGNFKVNIISADFPAQQTLAATSRLVIRVRNEGSTTVPDVAMTVNGFDKRKNNPQLANPERSQFVINGKPQTIGGVPEAKDEAPKGCETVYVNTWACGKLKPHAVKTFAWSVTAIQGGPYKITYRVAAGLDGKAKVVASPGAVLSGSFAGNVSSKPPNVKVASKDGKTIIVVKP